MEILAAVLTFIAVSALVLALISRRSGSSAVEARLTRMNEKPAEGGAIGNVLRTDTGTFPFLRRISASDWSERARVDLAQAGLTLKPSEYLLIRLFLLMMAAIVGILLTGGSGTGLLLTIVLGVVGFMLPSWYLTYRRNSRRNAIDRQLPEALSLIANSLRSGFAFSQAIELAVKQLGSPLRDELSEYLHDTSLGAPSDQALLAMAERTGSYDMEMTVSSILIQRTTGGNLSEILDNVAETVRERERLQGEIRALTASQRFTGLVLSTYPIFLGLLFAALVPEIYKVLWQEEAGRIVLAVGITLQVIGIVSIRRILRLEV